MNKYEETLMAFAQVGPYTLNRDPMVPELAQKFEDAGIELEVTPMTLSNVLTFKFPDETGSVVQNVISPMLGIFDYRGSLSEEKCDIIIQMCNDVIAEMKEGEHAVGEQEFHRQRIVDVLEKESNYARGMDVVTKISEVVMMVEDGVERLSAEGIELDMTDRLTISHSGESYSAHAVDASRFWYPFDDEFSGQEFDKFADDVIAKVDKIAADIENEFGNDLTDGLSGIHVKVLPSGDEYTL